MTTDIEKIHTERKITMVYRPNSSGSSITKSHLIVIPKGTLCEKVEGSQWTVSDLGFIPDKESALYMDASKHGIFLKESDIERDERIVFK